MSITGGKKPKGSQTAVSFKVLAVEHPRKKKITLRHKPLERRNKIGNHCAKNNGGNPTDK